MPWLWIIAGPNGAGKTTFANRNDIKRLLKRASGGVQLRLLNPDRLTFKIREENPDLSLNQANKRAADEIEAEVDRCISKRQNFMVETVLSTDKYVARVERARECGYRIGLVYLALSDPELAVNRVKLRVAQHGHDVPHEKVRTRWPRSLSFLPVFSLLADILMVFDNSHPGNPVLIARKNSRKGPVTIVHPDRIPQITKQLLPQSKQLN